MAGPNAFTDVVGTATKVGWGIEETCGSPVLAQFLTDYRSDSIVGTQERIASAALRSSRIRRKSGAGRLSVAGTHTLEVTPTVASRLLAASLGTVATTAPVDIANSGLSETGNTVTVVTATPHGFVPGEMVVIAGVTPAGYNGTFQVVSTADSTHFTYTNPTGSLGASSVQGTSTTTLYTHVLTPATAGPVALTHIIKKGDIFLHPGVKINEVALRLALDEICTADLNCMGLDEYVFDGGSTSYGAPVSGTHEAYLFPAGAGLPTVDAFNFTHGLISIDGLTSGALVTTEDVNNIVWTWSNNLTAKRGIRRTGRGDRAHVPAMFTPSCEMALYFNKTDFLMRSMGVAGGTIYPFKSTSCVLPGTIHMDMAVGSCAPYASMAIDMEAEFLAPVPAVEGEDFIMQQVTATGIEASGLTTFKITLKNTEATLLTPYGTALSGIALPS